jgi:WD40 repeat protein
MESTATPNAAPQASVPITAERLAEHSLPTAVLAIAHRAGTPWLYAGCFDGVYQLHVDSGACERLYEHRSYVSGLALLSQANVLVSAGYDGQLCWYDLASRAIFRRVLAHQFWSWDLALSPDQQRIATVTGQYLAGAENYAPRPESEPSVKVFDARTGDLRHALPHVPSVQAVCFSPDSRYVAAGNLMGEVRIWDLADGSLAAQWTTDQLTSWGIIKSHCYLGGVFAMRFTPDGEHLLLAGMGPMTDPMAGNGKQLWLRFAWREQPARQVDRTHEGESGEGLMESLAFSPDGSLFFMGGRNRGGDWNGAIFENGTGAKQLHVNTGFRICSAQFEEAGDRLFVAGSERQAGPKDGVYPAFGKVEVYRLQKAVRQA